MSFKKTYCGSLFHSAWHGPLDRLVTKNQILNTKCQPNIFAFISIQKEKRTASFQIETTTKTLSFSVLVCFDNFLETSPNFICTSFQKSIKSRQGYLPKPGIWKITTLEKKELMSYFIVLQHPQTLNRIIEKRFNVKRGMNPFRHFLSIFINPKDIKFKLFYITVLCRSAKWVGRWIIGIG